jgi:hypothetical protein
MATSSPICGGCSCGAVRYEASAEPVAMVNCHCRDCQRASGSAFAAVMVVPAAAVRIRGELKYHTTLGENGGTVERGFCPACGSRVANRLGRLPQIVGLMAGSLDDPSLFRPTADIFTASAHPWDRLAPETRKFERNLTR